jgi:hypothetical protein
MEIVSGNFLCSYEYMNKWIFVSVDVKMDIEVNEQFYARVV